MKKPLLVIMAAGMGSRYGGLKQMDPVDEAGHVILDYSIYDAAEAGFAKVIFVIKKENEEDFRRIVCTHLEGKLDYELAFQDLGDLPQGYALPEGRVKPWGTAHAVRSCRNLIKDEPFLVINADDYYGKDAFRQLYAFLVSAPKGAYAMAGYRIENTVTENGHVARGVCRVDDNGRLLEIRERTHIEKREAGAAFTEDEGATWTELPAGTPVSMNFWGFTPEFMGEVHNRFPVFLDRTLKENPLKGEYFLPGVVEELLKEGKCTVTVLPTKDKWQGVTYKEDKPDVVRALRELREAGAYRF